MSDGGLRLVDELATQVAGRGAVRDAFAWLLRAAADDPLQLVRARRDPLLTPVADRFDELLGLLEQRAGEEWVATRDEAAAAMNRCQPWLVLADTDVHTRYHEIQVRVDAAREQAEEGGPFGQIRATEAIEDVAAAVDALRVDCRAAITEAQRAAARRLSHVVQDAGVDLKATEDWVHAATAAQECHELLTGIDERDDDGARELLEDVRHRAGVHLEMLDVVRDELARRDKRRAEQRLQRQAEDRGVLYEVRERIPMIHLQFLATVALAASLFWLGPGVIVAVTPACFSLWRSYSGRAILQRRTWSIPRTDVEPTIEGLSTRLIISVLLIVVVGIESVMLWMLQSVGP